MQLTVFGASGKTGQQVVQQALSRGYQVVAYVRDPAKLSVTDANLKIIRKLQEQVSHSVARHREANCYL